MRHFDDLSPEEKLEWLFCDKCELFYHITGKCNCLNGVLRAVREDLRAPNEVFKGIIGGNA